MRSLFPYPDIFIEQFEKRFGMSISNEFVGCADSQLTNSFERAAGLKVNRLIVLGWAHETTFFYTKEPISRLASLLWVNNQTSDVVICWKTHSGQLIEPGDKSVDCMDIVFWLEEMKPLLYHTQLYPLKELPFNLGETTFKLDVKRLNPACVIIMTVRENKMGTAEHLSVGIDKFIADFNAISVEKDRENGLVHSWNRTVRGNALIYEIDTGTGGMAFIKKMLLFLSRLDSFERIEIE